MTVAVTPFPLFTPPRNEIDIAAPSGSLMASVSVSRVVGGVQTPIRQQPSAGFGAVTAYDYECPYNQNASYVATGTFLSSTPVTEWTETWANLSAWNNTSTQGSVSGGVLSIASWPGMPFARGISRSIAAVPSQVTISSLRVGIQVSLNAASGDGVEVEMISATQLQLLISARGVETTKTIAGTFTTSTVVIGILAGVLTVTVAGTAYTFAYAGANPNTIVISDGTAVGAAAGQIVVAEYPTAPTTFSYISSVNLFDDGSGRDGSAGYVAVGAGSMGHDAGADTYFQATAAVASGGGGLILESMTIGGGKLLPNTTYTYSGTIFAGAGTGVTSTFAAQLRIAGTGVTGTIGSTTVAFGAAFTRVSFSFTTLASGVVSFYLVNTLGAMAIGNVVAFRDAQTELGPVATPYVAPGSSSQIQLSPASGWMIHPTVPAKSVPISTTDRTLPGINNIGPVTSATTATVHEILGQSMPIISTSGPRLSDALTVIFAARTLAHEAQLNALLADQSPILFRFPDAGLGWQDGFYAIGDVQRERFAQVEVLQRRLFTLPLRMVQPPLGSVQNPGWSWADVAATFSSWNEVALAYNTWADMAADNRNPGY